MNTPTKLTVFRIILTVIVILLLVFPWHSIGFEFPNYSISGVQTAVSLKFVISGIIFIIASLTDFLDGYLARKNNQVTNLGKMLDAIADKILVNSSLIILAFYGNIPVIVPVIIVLRDTFVDAIKMQAASQGDVVAAIKSGKYKTATLMFGIVFAYFYNLPFSLFMSFDVAALLLYIACILSIVSGVQYFVMNRKYFLSK
jgi:CDP-diacylglycerol--glycerol-3-phosphate 3-phosphatidyltransferase